MKASVLLVMLVCGLVASVVQAQDGTWTQAGTTNPYNWSDTGNWLSGIVASGSGAAAHFTNSASGAQTVNLDVATTIGTLMLNRNQNLTITNSILTMADSAGAPVMSVSSGRTLTINNVVAGTQGLEKTGAGTLVLANNNTYSGGTVLNAGQITASLGDGSLGGSGGNVTFAGTATLQYHLSTAVGFNFDTLTINSGATATINKSSARNGSVTYALNTLTGAGTLNAVTDWGDTYDLANASAFTGNIYMRSTSGGQNITVKFKSLADAEGSSVQFAGHWGNVPNVANLILDRDSGPLTFNHRQIQIVSNPNNAGQSFTTTLQNDNTGTNIWIINTDLLNALSTATGARILGLAGSNTGDNEFRGSISNGTDGGVLRVTKSGSGKWILSGNNTYTGVTTVSAGTLALRGEFSLPHTGTLNRTGGTIDIAGRAKVDVLQAGGIALPPGIYGSTDSNAQFNGANLVRVNDTTVANFFRGDGVLYVGVPYPPSGTLIIVR